MRTWTLDLDLDLDLDLVPGLRTCRMREAAPRAIFRTLVWSSCCAPASRSRSRSKSRSRSRSRLAQEGPRSQRLPARTIGTGHAGSGAVSGALRAGRATGARRHGGGVAGPRPATGPRGGGQAPARATGVRPRVRDPVRARGACPGRPQPPQRGADPRAGGGGGGRHRRAAAGHRHGAGGGADGDPAPGARAVAGRRGGAGRAPGGARCGRGACPRRRPPRPQAQQHRALDRRGRQGAGLRPRPRASTVAGGGRRGDHGEAHRLGRRSWVPPRTWRPSRSGARPATSAAMSGRLAARWRRC